MFNKTQRFVQQLLFLFNKIICSGFCSTRFCWSWCFCLTKHKPLFNKMQNTNLCSTRFCCSVLFLLIRTLNKNAQGFLRVFKDSKHTFPDRNLYRVGATRGRCSGPYRSLPLPAAPRRSLPLPTAPYRSLPLPADPCRSLPLPAAPCRTRGQPMSRHFGKRRRPQQPAASPTRPSRPRSSCSTPLCSASPRCPPANAPFPLAPQHAQA